MLNVWSRRCLFVLFIFSTYATCSGDRLLADQPQQEGSSGELSAIDYPSLQAAIDANPGKMIHVPQGEYLLKTPLVIGTTGTGLYGFGTIVQQDAQQRALVVRKAKDVKIRSLTFRWSDCQELDRSDGIVIEDASNVVLDDIHVLDHKVQGNAISIRNSVNCTIRNCEVRNYKQISVDDRTDSELQGYAFRCIDGTGISVRSSTGTVIAGNRIVEQEIHPTKETKKKFRLGQVVPGRRPSKPGKLGKRAVGQDNSVDHWHQGSAIIVTAPTATRQTSVTGNYIENAGQGVDMHSDNLICSDNIVCNAGIGLKATHGCRNLIMNGNLLTQIDRWGILVNPGASSHEANSGEDGSPARSANVDGGIVIANNIITDFGGGSEYWHLGGSHDDRGSSYGIALLAAQLSTNPPLRDILIQGNIVYDTTRDDPSATGQPPLRPKYRYAVIVEQEAGKPEPRGIHFMNNLFHPGTQGISNIEIQE